jgi:signal transduction histidine kinase
MNSIVPRTARVVVHDSTNSSAGRAGRGTPAARSDGLGRPGAAPALFLPLSDEALRRLSHEMRTPLTAVLSTTESLLEGHYGDVQPTQRDALELVFAAGNRLLRTVDDVMVYVRLRAASQDVSLQPVSMQAILEGALAQVRTTAASCDVEVVAPPVSIPGGLCCDEALLRRALAHLIDNAVKFNKPGGHCSVQANVIGERVQMRVVDDGPGIAEDDRERVFAPFFQLCLHPDRRHRGVGIGLSLVREIANLHSGRAWIEDGTRGGCTACLEIPLHPPQRPT